MPGAIVSGCQSRELLGRGWGSSALFCNYYHSQEIPVSNVGNVQSHIECQITEYDQINFDPTSFVLLQVLTSTELRRELTDWVTKKFL